MVYGTARELRTEQETETSCAFFAGIECAFKAMDAIVDVTQGESDEVTLKSFETFRKLNKATGLIRKPRSGN